jgi:hypothetical protein
MEGPRAGELGRDPEGFRGDGLMRIDCKVGLAIVLNRGSMGRMRRRRRRRM